MWRPWLQRGAGVLAGILLLLAWPPGLAARAPLATSTPKATMVGSGSGTRRLVTGTAFVTRIVTQTPQATHTLAPTAKPAEPTGVPTEIETPVAQATSVLTPEPTTTIEEVEVAPGELPVTGDAKLAAVAAGLVPLSVMLLLALPALRNGRHGR